MEPFRPVVPARAGQPGMRVVIIGCGRVGSLAGSLLSGRGAEVVIVDRDEEAFATLSGEYSGFTVIGDAAEMGVLRQAGLSDADVVFAATDSDTLNLMVAQVAREIFGVQKVMARVFLPEWEGTYGDLGIGAISPVSLAVQAFLSGMEPSGAGRT
ncbi:MAG: potassium channel family protein [Longimicrobiales bacterium]